MGKKSKVYQRSLSEKGRKSPKRKKEDAVKQLRDSMPYPSTFGYDDMLPSQADTGTIIGWDCVSSDDDYAGPAVSLAEAAREFAEKCDPSENENLSDTPPLLKVWREESRHTKRPRPSLRSGRGRGRGRGGHHGLPLQPSQAETNALLARLQGHLVQIAAERKKKEDAEMLAEESAKGIEMQHNQCENLNLNTEKVSSEADSDGSEKLQEGHSFDMFTTQNEVSPLAVSLVKPANVTPENNNCTPRGNTFNQSTEELWTDDDDSLVVRATQDLFDSESYLTPKSTRSLKRRSFSPTERNCVGKHLVITSSPKPTPGAGGRSMSSSLTGSRVSSSCSTLTRSENTFVQPQLKTFNKPECHSLGQTVAKSASSFSSRTMFDDLTSATKDTIVPNETKHVQQNDLPISLPFQRYSQHANVSAGQTLGLNLSSTDINERLNDRPSGKLNHNGTSKVHSNASAGNVAGMRQGQQKLGPSFIVPSKVTGQSVSAKGASTSTNNLHRASATGLGVDSVKGLVLPRPTQNHSYPVGMIPSTSNPRCVDLTFKKPAAIPSKISVKSPRRSVPMCPQSPNLNDTSLSDDLLASLAEPDDMLDSEMIVEDDTQDFLSYLLEPPKDEPSSVSSRHVASTNDSCIVRKNSNKENSENKVTSYRPVLPVKDQQQKVQPTIGDIPCTSADDMEVDLFDDDDDGLLGESELLEFLNETECNESKIHVSPTWSGGTSTSWAKPVLTSKQQAPKPSEFSMNTMALPKPAGTNTKLSTVASSKQSFVQPGMASSGLYKTSIRHSAAIVHPTPNTRPAGITGRFGGTLGQRPAQFSSGTPAQHKKAAAPGRPEPHPSKVACSKPNSTAEQSKRFSMTITSSNQATQPAMGNVTNSGLYCASSSVPPTTSHKVLQTCSSNVPFSRPTSTFTNVVSITKSTYTNSTAGHKLIPNGPVCSKVSTAQATSNGYVFSRIGAGTNNSVISALQSQSSASVSINKGVTAINVPAGQNMIKPSMPNISQLHQQSVQVADSGCHAKAEPSKKTSQSSGSNSSSQGSGSQKTYTPEEIERKRMEALKKKQNRLKLCKKPKAVLSM